MNAPEPIRVLIIDDDKLALTVMRKVVEAENCFAEVSSSSQQALTKLRDNHYDAVLCDMRMGDKTGQDFYQQIQQDFPDYQRKIIFATGDLASETTWEFVDEWRLPLILKPFNGSEFRQRLRTVVGERLGVVRPSQLEEPAWNGAEQRQQHRSAIKAEVRARLKKRPIGNADIGSVINASKDGVLFLTDREYRVGMEVYVAFPYAGNNDIEQEGCVVRVAKFPEGRCGVAVALGEAAEAARMKFEYSKEDPRRNHIPLEISEREIAPERAETARAEEEARRLAEELAELKEAHDRVLDQRDRLAAEEFHIKRQLHELSTAKTTLSHIVNDLTTQMQGLQEELAAGEEHRFLATHDSLTGLWNRAAILDFLKRELLRAQREGTSVVVLMADLDHFKKVNDTYGHLAGDAVLREVAQRLQAGVREYDAVGRYGGEEFLIVLSAGPEIPLKHAESLRALVSAGPVYTDDGAIPITLSLGIAASSPVLFQAEALLRAADTALYRAKRSGRNCVELADTEEAASSSSVSS